MVFNFVNNQFTKFNKYNDAIKKFGDSLDGAALHAKALSESGMSKAVHEYIAKLGVASAAQMTFGQKCKLATIAIKEQAAAIWASPLGKAAIIAAGIFAIVKAVDYLYVSVEETKERLVELDNEMQEITDSVRNIHTEFSNLKQSAGEVIPRFAELAKGVNAFGENVSLTDEEYSEFLRLNNQIAEMFPQINSGMDSNGNAMLSLSLSADTLTNSLWELVEAEREAANAEIAKKLPDALGKAAEAQKNYQRLIDDVEKQKENLTKAYTDIKNLPNDVPTPKQYDINGISDADAMNEYNSYLKQLGVGLSMDVANTGPRSATYSVSYDFDMSEVEQNYQNALAGLDRQIHNLEQQAAARWADVNPIVSAWLQTDFMYNDLNDRMQFIVRTMVSGVDFSSLGLTTQEQVEDYVHQYIVEPLFGADEEVKTAFSKITDWNEQLQNGEITFEQFSTNVTSAFDALYGKMDPISLMVFVSTFVRGFKQMGIAGDDFDTVLSNLIVQWGKIPTAIEQAESALDGLKTELGKLKDETTAVNDAIAEQGENGSLTTEAYEALIAASDDYAACIEYENGYIQLNTDKAKELLEAKTELQILELEQAKIQEAENYKAIAQAIADADGSNTDFIATKQAELEVSKQLITQYRVVQSELAETLSEYNKWKTAQNAPESGDMYDDTIKALEQIQEGLKTGKVGTEKYEASLALIVPEVNRDDVTAYMDKLKRYISEDATGVSNFITDSIAEGLMVDDGAGNISIVSDATIQDFCNSLKITPSMAQAIFGELEEYGWEFNWSTEDFIDAIDTVRVPEEKMQVVQDDLDTIAEKADIVSAKVIGDMGAQQTAVALQSIIGILIQIDNQKISDKHYNVYAHTIADDGGASNAHGTSHAVGGRTLVGELGPELVVSDDRYYTVGVNGAEFVDLKRGDMVFNHIDTQKIMNGKSGARGQALRRGTVGLGTGADRVTLNDVSGSVTVTIVSGGGEQPIGDGSSGDSDGSSGSSSKNDDESWFEKQLKEHQHLVDMDKESRKDYLDWLDDAYKKAYDEGVIDLDAFYQYQEEVYHGIQDLFKDHLGDIDHEISTLEAGVGNSDEIIALSLQAIQDIEAELAAARAAGLDENGDYIQYLEQQWQEYNQTVIDLREQAESEAKSSISDLVEYRIKMLKQEIEDQKDALNKKLDDLGEFYDKQREMLQDQYDEEKYLEEQNEKRKSVTDIRSELAMLENDDSAWAQKRKLELQEDLSDAEKELNSFEKDHALDVTLDMLDEQQEAQEAQIQAQIDALDKRLNDPHALYNQALADITNNTQALYDEFIKYNNEHGTGNPDDIVEMWREAYKADLEYQATHNGEHLDDIAIGNYTGYVIPENPEPPKSKPEPGPPTPESDPKHEPESEKSYPYGKASDTSGDIGVGSSGTDVKAIQYALNELGFGNSGTQDCDGQFGSRTQSAVKAFQSAMGISADGIVGKNTRAKFKAQGYASGTDHATPGWHELFEGNQDEYIFTSSDGSRYRMFNGGEKVLNANATNFLYDFATSGGGIVMKMLSDLFGITNLGNIQKPVQAIEIHSGDIIVQGNANERTVSEIRRAQRENLKYVISEFNKLNK